MKKLQRFLLGLIIFAISLSDLTVYQADEKTVVKVGVYEMEGFHYRDAYGQLVGYGIDYLNVVASITGWEYEYVEVVDFADACDKLEKKEIDLIAPAMMTEARKEKFDYSEMNFGTEYTVLVTKESRSDLYYEDFEAFDGIKVAVVKDYPLTEYFKSYMRIHEFSSGLVYYNTVDEANKALESGQVDAMVTSIMDMREGQQLLARFAPQPFYFLTWKGNTSMLNTLNTAMQQVQNTYPTLMDELLVEYYPIYEMQFFTREESEFIKEHQQPLRVA